MKGKIAQHSLLSLSQEERKTFLERLAALPNGETMTKLGEFLLESELDTDRDLSRRFHLSQYDREKYLKEIGKILLSVLNGDEASSTKTFELARRLVRHSFYDAAIEIIESGIHQASAEGHYQLIVWFWDLVDFFHVTPTIRAMQRKEANRHLKDITKFNKWISRLAKARTKPTGAERTAMLQSIRQKALARASKHELSPIARYYYLKLISSCDILLFDFEQAIPQQMELLSHVCNHPEACLDPEFIQAKETRLLALTYWVTNHYKEYRGTLETLRSLPESSRHVQYEKFYARFPFEIAAAANMGDLEGGYVACQAFFELLKDERFSFSLQYITNCLYYCAYFYLVAGDYQSLSHMFTRFKRYSRSDFKPRYYLMSQFLRVLYAVDKDEWEDALTFSNNLKKIKGSDTMPCLVITIDFLIGKIKDYFRRNSGTPFDSLAADLPSLKERLNGLELLQFCDVVSWLESKVVGCPMIEIVNHQATSPQQNQSLKEFQ
jgi:hypothetical protein